MTIIMDVLRRDKVCVLLSTYNGEKYIGEQLRSLYEQEDVDISLLVRDDGSTDATCAILDSEQAAGRLSWYTGKNLKPAFSFWNLLQQAPDSPCYAFCDQDDVWDKDKLKIAVATLEQAGEEPALYFCQTRLVDSSLNEIKSVRISPLLTYGEALIYHFVTGCTVVFNKAMRDILLHYTPSYLRMHDLWAYVVAQAVDAKIYFDPNPHISYRQHANNVVGSENSLKSIWKKRFARLGNNERIRSRIANELLVGYGDNMSGENHRLTTVMAGYRNSFASWMRLLFSRRLRCSSLSINITSRLAILLRIL